MFLLRRNEDKDISHISGIHYVIIVKIINYFSITVKGQNNPSNYLNKISLNCETVFEKSLS